MYERMLANIAAYPNIMYMDGYSTEIIPKLCFDADAYYIDGNHRTGAVEADVICCKEKAREGDIIGGHDYVEGNNIAGVVHRYFESVQTFGDMSWLAIA
jgi:hypothetical protein